MDNQINNPSIPKPHPPVKKPLPNATPVKDINPPARNEPKTVQEKKTPFVPQPHLTEKPFRNHSGLAALKKGLTQ